MANYGKGITVASGFDLAGNPVDSKYLVATLAEANAFIDNGVAYEGMQVYCVADKTIYVFNGTSFQTMQASSGAVDIDLTPYATLAGEQTFTGKKTFNEVIEGTAKKAEQDAAGNVIADTYAPLESPALTGTPTAPTAAAGTETTQVATTAFAAAVAKSEAAAAAGTAKEEAIAAIPTNIGAFTNDADYATKTEVSDAVSGVKEEIEGAAAGTYAPIASPALTGVPTAPTAEAGTATTQVATTAFVKDAVDTASAAASDELAAAIEEVNKDIEAANKALDEHTHVWADVTDAPTKVSAFENDAAYITAEANVASATKLAEAKNINGVAFDGTQDITIDIGVEGPAASTDAHVAVFDGATGKLIKDSGFTIRSSVPADAVFTDTTYELEDFGIEASADEINYVKGVTSAIQGQIDSKADEGHNHDAAYLGINANAVSASKLAEAKNIAVSGDATGSASFDGSADATIAVTLANSGVTAGTYAKVTVDAKGRVTAGAALEAADIPALTLAKVTDAGTAASKNVGTAAGEVPVLGDNGKLDTAVLPAITITDTFVVADEAAMLAVDAQVGDIVVRTDVNKTFVLQKDGANVAANWVALAAPTDSGYVSAVNGKTGSVTLTTTDITEGNNLYFTEARATANFEANIAATNVSALADGTHVVLDTDEIIIDCGGAA